MIPRPAPPLDHIQRLRKSAVIMLHLTIILVLLLFNTCLSMQLVENLPGFPGNELPFALHTGYIGVGKNEQVQLFYYFIESEGNPKEDPLVLWITGGPACSGLRTMLFEVGPFTIDYANSYRRSFPLLTVNEYSWTKVASMIFIDQPVGTGFSYSETLEGYHSSDTASAKHIYDFLQKWLVNNPKYFGNPLYIAGDSYAGLLVPLIVEKVYDSNELGSGPPMNMKGYVLGNPSTDRYLDANERIPYAHRMGLVSNELYQSVKELCHGNYVLNDMKNVLCIKALKEVYQLLDYIRWYQILEPWCDYVIGDVAEHVISYNDTPTNFLQSVATKTKSWCRNDNYLSNPIWANDKSVQEALHVREGKITKWVSCNSTIENPKTQQEKMAYIKNVTSTITSHKALTHKPCRTLIYSGDHDMFVPHISTEKWIDSLNLPIQSDWRPWFVDGQVAGYTMTYGQGVYELTYATVKGAGHTSPEYKPVECFAMIRRWFEQNAL